MYPVVVEVEVVAEAAADAEVERADRLGGDEGLDLRLAAGAEVKGEQLVVGAVEGGEDRFVQVLQRLVAADLNRA